MVVIGFISKGNSSKSCYLKEFILYIIISKESVMTESLMIRMMVRQVELSVRIILTTHSLKIILKFKINLV